MPKIYKKSLILKRIRKSLESGSTYGLAILASGVSSRQTVDYWRKKRPLIDRYINECENRSDLKRAIRVEDSLLKRAIGYKYEETTSKNGKVIKTVTKEVAPDTTAQIFFLTNRCPERWADKRAVVNNTNINKVSTTNILPENIANIPEEKLAEIDACIERAIEQPDPEQLVPVESAAQMDQR